MKCFYHNDRDAMGVCKACGKGLCMECAADTGKGIACRSKCEEEVRSINILVQKNKKAYKRAGKTYLRNAIFYMIIGILFLVGGIAELVASQFYGLILAAFGVIFIILAFSLYFSSREIDKT